MYLTSDFSYDIIGAKWSEDMEETGKIIRRAMQKQGITVNELARLTGKAQSTVSNALKSKNMSYEVFASYMEALGFEICYKDAAGERLHDEKIRHAPPTRVTIDGVQYNSMTAEPLVCAEQSDGLFAELYRKRSDEYFVVYFEKDRRGTINPVSVAAASSFWRQYKGRDQKDDYLD